MENKETLETKVFTALGEVSTCWLPNTGSLVFDSTRAMEIGDRLMKDIKEATEVFVVDVKAIPENYNLEDLADIMRKQPIQIAYSKPSLKEAIEVLQENLKEDKSEGSYYHAWQCNIAMAFKDEYWRKADELSRDDLRHLNIHEIANQAAKDFLDLLIKQ